MNPNNAPSIHDNGENLIVRWHETSLKSQVGGDHYKDLPIQPVEFCQRNKLGYCEANAVKYICRHGKKGGRTDIEKAIHYLEMLLEMEYPESPTE